MAGTAGWRGAVYQAAQASLTFTSVALTDGGAHTIYTISDATKCMWDDAVAATIEESTDSGSTWHAAPAGYTIDYIGGVITYAVARTSTYQYRASGKYLPITQIARATAWTMDVEDNIVNDSEFGSQWETNSATQGKASGTIKLNWQDSAWLTAMTATSPTTAQPKLVLRLYTNFSGATRYEGFALITKDGIDLNVSDLVGEELTWNAVGKLYYRNT